SVGSEGYRNFNQRLIEDLRANGGRATSGPFEGRELLILTTRGAKSGERRENPLAFSRAGEAYVIIGSKGGAPTHPAWYHNLLATREVIFECISLAVRAAAGGSRQGWQCVVVNAAETTRAIGAHYRRSWYDYAAAGRPNYAEGDPRREQQPRVVSSARDVADH